MRCSTRRGGPPRKVDLKAHIIRACDRLRADQGLHQRVLASFVRRLEACVRVGGDHFEHIIGHGRRETVDEALPPLPPPLAAPLVQYGGSSASSGPPLGRTLTMELDDVLQSVIEPYVAPIDYF